MGNLTPFGTSPFDVLFKDFFKSDVDYQFADATKLNHPVDIYEASEGLNIDIACVDQGHPSNGGIPYVAVQSSQEALYNYVSPSNLCTYVSRPRISICVWRLLWS